MAFETDFINGILHQMHGTNSMLKPIVNSARIDKMRKSQLSNAPQSLVPGVINQLQNKWMSEGDETINGIIDNFAFLFLFQMITGINHCNWGQR